jgi:hypothetical protein
MAEFGVEANDDDETEPSEQLKQAARRGSKESRGRSTTNQNDAGQGRGDGKIIEKEVCYYCCFDVVCYVDVLVEKKGTRDWSSNVGHLLANVSRRWIRLGIVCYRHNHRKFIIQTCFLSLTHFQFSWERCARSAAIGGYRCGRRR